MAQPYIVKNFKDGIITRIEQESLPKGSSSGALNWLTFGDHIALRHGQAVMGTSNAGVGRVSGLHVGTRFDGVQVPFYSYGRKVKYFDSVTEDWIETSVADILPTTADDEDVSFSEYHSLAGAMAYFSSPSSSIYKIMLANPANVRDMVSTSHRGKIKIKQNRMFLWDRKDSNGGSDKTGIYGSYIDKDELSDFTEVVAESVGTGDGSTTTFTHTLAAVTTPRTAMYVRVTDGTETFIDDRNGVLTGNLGGTGTVNYTTGAISVTFNTAPTVATPITTSYYWENSASNGITDFSKSTPRTAGQGFVFRQDDGGVDAQNIGSIGGAEYCLHKRKTWKLTLSSDDTDATNLIYRAKVGTSNWRAFVESGDGIYYVDDVDQNNPFIRLLQLNSIGTEAIPSSISDNIDLSPYRFDRAAMREWGLYIVVSCRTNNSTINNRMLFYHKLWKSWDVTDFRGSVMDEFDRHLIAGDDGSDNVYRLFDGVSDEDATIDNFWISGKTNCDMEGIKRFTLFVVSGLIGIDQRMRVSFSLDGGDFVEAGIIEGDGSYVDTGTVFHIGSSMIGSEEIGGSGGGDAGDSIPASPYRREFLVNTDLFEFIRFKFEALEVGYLSVSEYQCQDMRFKGRRLPMQARRA